jgi:hypothetical protein
VSASTFEDCGVTAPGSDRPVEQLLPAAPGRSVCRWEGLPDT